jgi:hypothetical protein
MTHRSLKRLGLAAAAAVALAASAANAQPAGIDPQATAILKKSMDYLAGLKAFSVGTTSTIEATLTSGQKLQFDSVARATLQRPNKLVARRGKGDVVNQAYYYDGKTLTRYNPDEKYYATLAAPATIEPMLDFARDTLDVNAPAGDPAFLGALQKVASVAKTYGKITITVIGHPDKGGSEAERQRLSSQRAEAVRLQLIGMGVPSILVSASGNPRSTWEDGRVELVIHPVIGG